MTPNERVKIIRNELKLTLEKFGNKLGVTKVAISNLEKGNRNLTEQMARAICREYNVEYQWLMSGEGNMFVSGDEELNALIDNILFGENEFYINLIKACASLTDDELDMIQNMIDKLK